tara:strand:+ start:21 stop:170 length:150 start_codon:yes stop_codon:yes gene_type:complete
MSGSGPSCYGLFEKYKEAKEIYDTNQELFSSLGFNSWLCEFKSKGIEIL